MLAQILSSFSSAIGWTNPLGYLFGGPDSGPGTSGILSPRAESPAASTSPTMMTPRQWQEIARERFGPPVVKPKAAYDHIVSDIVMFPYRGRLDFGNYGRETPQSIYDYRYQYRRNPIVHSATYGAQAAASCSDVTVLPNRHCRDKRLANEVRDFVDWTISTSAEGWVGLLDNIGSTARTDGLTICGKKLVETRWRGRPAWGFDHTRQLDTAVIRLQTDVYRNVVSIVNMVRGLEYYSPDEVLLYTHNKQYGDPFGIPDSACVSDQADIWQAAYQAWLLVVEHYGLPFMLGQYGDAVRKEAIAQALQGLYDGGWAVISKDDMISAIGIANAAGTGTFKDLADVTADNIVMGLRGSSLPFKEGGGGKNSHGDTSVERISSDAWEYHFLLKSTKVVEHQLFRGLVANTFGPDPSLVPFLKLGGVNWKETNDIIDVFTKAKKELDFKLSREHVEQSLGLPTQRDEDDGFGESEEDEKDITQVVNTIKSLSESVAAGTLQQAAAVAMVVDWYPNIDEAKALRYFPTVLPVNRVAAAEQAAQPQPPALPQGQPTPQPQAFAEGYDDWRVGVDAYLERLKTGAV
jgi:hypothetical protein